MRKFSKLVRSARSHIHIFFLNVSVLSFYCRLWRHAISNKRDYCIDCNYVCRFILWPENGRSLAHISYNFYSVGTFGGLAPPPPNTTKLATLLVVHSNARSGERINIMPSSVNQPWINFFKFGRKRPEKLFYLIYYWTKSNAILTKIKRIFEL